MPFLKNQEEEKKMKKITYGFVLLAVFLFMFQVTHAQVQTCGNNVAYTIEGDTITFSKGSGNSEPSWTNTCRKVIWDNPAITKVKASEKIKVPNKPWMFDECSNLISIDMTNFDISSVTNMTYMFGDCRSLKELDVSNWDTSNVTSMYYMFHGCTSLEKLDVSNWDTSNVTDMNTMFGSCNSLKELDVSNWDTSNVTNMAQMFFGCWSLTELDVSNWKTSSLENMGSIFTSCRGLNKLDVSNWNTSNVWGMAYAFYDCNGLTELDLSGWDTSNVTYMHNMFMYCPNLKKLNISGWNTSSLERINSMFQYCTSLEELDLSSWDTSNVTTESAPYGFGVDSVFSGCSSLHTLTLGPKTFENDIFSSLPSYSSGTWYYKKAGPAASNPLPLRTTRGAASLFTEFDSDTMAGTWTTAVVYIHIGGKDIQTTYNGQNQQFTPDYSVQIVPSGIRLSEEQEEAIRSALSISAVVSGKNAGTYPYGLKEEMFSYASEDFIIVLNVFEDGSLIIQSKPLDAETIRLVLDPEKTMWTGRDQEVKYSVYDMESETYLIENTDYLLDSENSVTRATEVGIYPVTVTAADNSNYTGSATAEWEILTAPTQEPEEQIDIFRILESLDTLPKTGL